MPHTAEEKKRVITRLRRIQGQALALERAVEAGTECGPLLQQLAALRGASTSLMAEVLDSHMRETFGSLRQSDPNTADTTDPQADAHIDDLMRIIRSYLK